MGMMDDWNEGYDEGGDEGCGTSRYAFYLMGGFAPYNHIFLNITTSLLYNHIFLNITTSLIQYNHILVGHWWL